MWEDYAVEESKTVPISIDRALAGLSFLPDRSPTTDGEENYFARLAPYRDGSMFVAWYAGTSEWERHNSGDEIVMVVEGATTLVILDDGTETTMEPKHRIRWRPTNSSLFLKVAGTASRPRLG